MAFEAVLATGGLVLATYGWLATRSLDELQKSALYGHLRPYLVPWFASAVLTAVAYLVIVAAIGYGRVEGSAVTNVLVAFNVCAAAFAPTIVFFPNAAVVPVALTAALSVAVAALVFVADADPTWHGGLVFAGFWLVYQHVAVDALVWSGAI